MSAEFCEECCQELDGWCDEHEMPYCTDCEAGGCFWCWMRDNGNLDEDDTLALMDEL